MSGKARLRATGTGQCPVSPGWFVLHASEAPWLQSSRFGRVCNFEGDAPFPEVGVNLHVVWPGQPACLYHRESAQEDFFVLSGECLLLIEEEQHRLRAGHYVHCPPDTGHVFVGAGEAPCAILMIGRRPAELKLQYPVSPLAARHGASVTEPTDDPRIAYSDLPVFGEAAEPWWPLDRTEEGAGEP